MGVAGTIIGFGAGAFNPILGGVVGDVASEYITQSLLGNRVGIGDYLFSGAIGGYSGFLGGKIGIGVRLLINRKSGIAAAVARTAMNRTEFLQANQAFRRYQNLHSSGASEFAGTATTSVSSGVINGAGGVQCDCQ